MRLNFWVAISYVSASRLEVEEKVMKFYVYTCQHGFKPASNSISGTRYSPFNPWFLCRFGLVGCDAFKRSVSSDVAQSAIDAPISTSPDHFHVSPCLFGWSLVSPVVVLFVIRAEHLPSFPPLQSHWSTLGPSRFILSPRLGVPGWTEVQ